MTSRPLIALMLALACAPAAHPQQQSQPSQHSISDPRPTAHAAARTSPLRIDGHLDEPAWSSAPVIADFLQLDPVQGVSPTQRTEVRILYDASAIYIGARMYDSLGKAGVHGVLTRHDQLLSRSDLTSDLISFGFDTFRDGNGETWFKVNPLGVKGESQDGDATYDPVWDVATSVDSLGWVAEVRIPYSQLRFSRDSVQSWGMQVIRTSDRNGETDLWAFHRRNESTSAKYFGVLDGLRVPAAARQVEVVPYVTTRQTYKLAAVGDPFHANAENALRVGGDVKYLVTSNLTLNATINPDFGQVEVDPAVVNLSAFETTFQEQRPFFVADSRYFSAPGLACHFCMHGEGVNPVYTRRIGRSPQLAGLVGSRAAYMDAPDATSIAGAAKVTGRTSGGVSIGMMDAVTNPQEARFLSSTGVRGREEIEPLTNYFVGRVRKDMRDGLARIGFLGTLVNRELKNPDEVARLRAHAAYGGLDFNDSWKRGDYTLRGLVAMSSVGGDTATIRRTQESSARYYQRPDRTETSDGLFNTRYDPTRTSLDGYAMYARIAKDNGNWLWETQQSWRSPGFETNDLGTLRRTDSRWMNATLGYGWNTPAKWYRDASLFGEWEQELDFGGNRVDFMYHGLASITLPNYHSASVLVMYEPQLLSPTLTRGGPMVKQSGYWLYNGFYGTDSRKPVVLGASATLVRPIEDAELHSEYFGPSVTYKPSTWMSIGLTPSWNHSLSGQQYVTTVADATAPAGFAGHRYVFSRIEQRSLSMGTRINATFSPTLTLELFAQPFVASGDYSSFREFAAPRGAQMVRYGVDAGTVTSTIGARGMAATYSIDPDGTGPAKSFDVPNPDFTVRSLRGTAVVRWEYHPGSTLFFVWTQERDGADSFGDFNFSRDRAALFSDRPTNIFQVKATYWLGR